MAAEPSGYTVVVVRSGDWWAITVPALPGVFSQCKRLDQVDAMAREAIALMRDVGPDAVGEIDVDIVLPSDVTADLAELRRSERVAENARRTAASAQRRVAERLRASGLSVRDIGRVLGISHQRVSQVLARRSA